MEQDVETFIRTYMQAFNRGKTRAWVADQLGMTKAQVSNRIGTYADRGVNLPKLNSDKKRLDVDAMNQLISSLS